MHQIVISNAQSSSKSDVRVEEEDLRVNIVKERSYELVVLDGDSIYKSFYSLIQYPYTVVDTLTRQHRDTLVIAPSSREKDLSKHLSLHPSCLGIISTIQANPIEVYGRYHHPHIKLMTNSIQKCILCIQQLNHQAPYKEVKVKEGRPVYNPGRANMWQRLENQWRNQCAKSKRLSEIKEQRELSAKSYKLYSERVKEKRQKQAMTVNQEYGTTMLPSNLGKIESLEPSTRTNSQIPSTLSPRPQPPTPTSPNPISLKHSRESQQSLSFGQLSSIPSLAHTNSLHDLRKPSLQSNKQNIPLPLTTLRSTQPIQLLFKTSNLYINKLQEYYCGSQLIYKYQSIQELKGCLRYCHQDMLSVVILDADSVIDTMKLLAIFDHLHYLIVGDDDTLHNLKFLTHDNIGFINDSTPLSKAYKSLSAHIRSLKMEHYRISEGDLRNYSDRLLMNTHTAGITILYEERDRHISTLINRIDLSKYILLQSFRTVEDLKDKIGLYESHGGEGKMIVILNGFMASMMDVSMGNTRSSRVRFVIFEPNAQLCPPKSLSTPLVTNDNQLVSVIQTIIQ